MITVQAKLTKLAFARRDTFLYKHKGTVTNNVTMNTTPKRTAPIDTPKLGKNLTNTFDNVSPTTTLYEIIAARKKMMLYRYYMKYNF